MEVRALRDYAGKLANCVADDGSGALQLRFELRMAEIKALLVAFGAKQGGAPHVHAPAAPGSRGGAACRAASAQADRLGVRGQGPGCAVAVLSCSLELPPGRRLPVSSMTGPGRPRAGARCTTGARLAARAAACGAQSSSGCLHWGRAWRCVPVTCLHAV